MLGLPKIIKYLKKKVSNVLSIKINLYFVVLQLVLSKHHSMLGNKRINVLYTTQKNGKVTKAQAKVSLFYF
jgi:hypothetical protein